MLLLAVKFGTTPDRVFAQIPLTRRGVVASGNQPFACYPGTGSEQCPGCGGDIAEWWVIEAENPGVATPELGESFSATCRNQLDLDHMSATRRAATGVTKAQAECGYRTTGTVVEMER